MKLTTDAPIWTRIERHVDGENRTLFVRVRLWTNGDPSLLQPDSPPDLELELAPELAIEIGTALLEHGSVSESE